MGITGTVFPTCQSSRLVIVVGGSLGNSRLVDFVEPLWCVCVCASRREHCQAAGLCSAAESAAGVAAAQEAPSSDADAANSGLF